MATSSIGRVVKLDNKMARKIIEAEKNPSTIAKKPPKGLGFTHDVSVAAAKKRAHQSTTAKWQEHPGLPVRDREAFDAAGIGDGDSAEELIASCNVM